MFLKNSEIRNNSRLPGEPSRLPGDSSALPRELWVQYCFITINNDDRLLSTFFKAMTAAFPVTVSRKTMQTAYLVRSSDTQTLLINNNWRNLTNN